MESTSTVLERPRALRQPEIPRAYLRPAEVVAMTGSSKSVVFAALLSGDLRGYKKNGSWFIPVAAVTEWIEGDSRSA